MISNEEVLALLGSYPENTDNLNFLLEQLATRVGVLPFVGAGMSVPFGFPQWGQFLLSLAAEAGIEAEIGKRLAASEYEEAAADLLQALQPRRFQDLMSKNFGDQVIADRSLTGAVRELTDFPSGPIITTNFDRVLERAFEQAGKKLLRFVHSQASLASEAFQQGKAFVLKLHGDWQDQQTRILTLNEYAGAYGEIDRGEINFNLPVPTLLFALLSTRCCLFLGCGLRNDRTMRVLRLVSKGRPDVAHYAIVERPASLAEARLRAAELSAQSVRPIWYAPGRHDLIQPLLSFLSEKARQAAEAAFAKQYSPSPGARNVPNNIPVPGSPTIGRAAELRHVLEMLLGARLVSITGAGGSGKSRLAIDVANAAKDRYENGIWFIPLADLAKKADREAVLPSRIARIIGIPEQARRPPNEALAERLASGNHLLVLDNCEHLIQSTREVTEYLLQQCPGLSILATTRRPLKLPQERLYPLAPLTTVERGVRSLEEIRQNDSVQLFVERARQRLPEYALNSANAESVADLCRALDGIPLAIEVAAARLGVRSAEQMNRDSRELLSSLGDVRGGDLRRWKTLTSALRWSYGLLRPHEQTFMRSLAVFDGGWTEEAAQAVCPRAVHDSTSVLNYLQTLYESSLIVSTELQGAKRFRFLEPIRQMAEVQLTPDERRDCERRHALFFLSFAERAAPELLQKNQAEWLDNLQTEADNLRAAIRWSVATVDPEVGLRLMASLWRFNEIRGYLNEGRERAAQVLAIAGTERLPALRSKALSGAGMLAYRQGDFDAAKQLFEDSLKIEEALGNQEGISDALNDLGNVSRMNGDYLRARELYVRTLAIEEQSGNRRKIAVAKFNLGSVAFSTGQNEEAVRLLNESLTGFRDCGNEWESGFPLNSLSQVAVAVGDYPLAFQYGEKSLSVRRKVADTKGIADALRTLSWASIEAADFVAARQHLAESISLARGLGDKRGISETLELFALMYCRCGEVTRSIELFAAAERIRQGYSYAPPPVRISEREDALATAKQSVGEEKYASAWRQGAALALSDAIESALEGK